MSIRNFCSQTRGAEAAYQMPFTNNTVRTFDRSTIQSLNLNQNGVYGIFNDREWLYVGRGDIRTRMLAHLNGDVPGLVQARPTHWVAELVFGDGASREKQLILELQPRFNQRVG